MSLLFEAVEQLHTNHIQIVGAGQKDKERETLVYVIQELIQSHILSAYVDPEHVRQHLNKTTRTSTNLIRNIVNGFDYIKFTLPFVFLNRSVI